MEILNARRPHIHLENEAPAVAMQQVKMLHTRAGRDAEAMTLDTGFDEKRGGAAGAVAGNGAGAAVRVPEVDARIHSLPGLDREPAIRADAGMAIAGGAGNRREIDGYMRQTATPGQQKIVASAV